MPSTGWSIVQIACVSEVSVFLSDDSEVKSSIVDSVVYKPQSLVLL